MNRLELYFKNVLNHNVDEELSIEIQNKKLFSSFIIIFHKPITGIFDR
jgi:hypothetical protein